MVDLKTTQERRDRFRTWLRDDTRDHLSIRAWCVAEDACDVGGSAWFEATREFIDAVDEYRKDGGK